MAEQVVKVQRQAEASSVSGWILGSSCLLFFLMSFPAFFGSVPTLDDLGAFHLPLRSIYAASLQNGDSWDWAPQLFSGFYLAGEGQVGTYHPMHWLLYRCLPLAWAFNAELLLSYPFMYVGMVLFLKRTVANLEAALFGAMVFTFSGFNLLHFVHPNAIAIAAHLPWWLYAMDIAWSEKRSSRRVFAEVAVALLLASQLLLGYPQYVWFSLFAAFCFVLFLSWRDGLRIRTYCLFVTCGILGGMLGAIQLLPTFDVLSESTRQTSDPTLSHTGALHPLNLVQLIAPYLFKSRVLGGNTHEFGLYIGAVPLLLLLWLATRLQQLQRRRDWTLATGCFGFLMLFLAFGRNGLLYHLQTFLPLVGRFRLPARYILLFQFAVAVGVAVAFAERRLLEGRPSPPSNGRLFGLPVICSLALATIVPVLIDHEFLASPLRIASGPILIGSAAGLMRATRKQPSKLALVALVVFTAADLGVYGLSYAVLRQRRSLEEFANTTDQPPEIDNYRILVNQHNQDDRNRRRSGNRWILSGWHQADGYAGLEPQSQLLGEQISMQGLQAAGVRWVREGDDNVQIPGLMRGHDGWLEVPNPCPRFQLIQHGIVDDDVAAAIQGISPHETAIVGATLNLSPGYGSIEVLHDRPGFLELRIDVSSRQLLVISERFHEGWVGTQENHPLPLLRVNGDFLGCVLDSGVRTLQLSFQPKSLRYGKRITQCGLAFLLLFGYWRFRDVS